MAFWEGLFNSYFMDKGTYCVTVTNDISHGDQLHNWRSVRAPYYKHTHKKDGSQSVQEKFNERLDREGPGADFDIQSSDIYDINMAEVDMKNLEGCSLGSKYSDWPED
jgi:hypothetical protein